MNRIPDFFRPRFKPDGDEVVWDDYSWNHDGVVIRLSLRAVFSDEYPQVRAKGLETMRQAAWQAVWWSIRNANSSLEPDRSLHIIGAP